MNRRTLLFTALGLTLGAGAALAAGHAYAERHDDDHHRRRPERHGERGEREGGPGRSVAADPNPATAPVPRNGLFQNGARPKVDVQ
jgi:hypothetical protein